MKKRSRPKNLRKSQRDDSVDDTEDTSDIRRRLEESKKLQSLRSRLQGVNSTALAFGEVSVPLVKNGPTDTFKLSSGGLMAMADLTNDFAEEDEANKKMSSNFAAETKQKDEDLHMLSYIEDEMTKRSGTSDKCSIPQKTGSAYENKLGELYAIPEYLKGGSKLNSEEMLSNQILSGIPEFELGVEEKFRNIQATEVAVRKLVREQLKPEEGESSLIPINLATNFTKHKERGEGRNKSTVLSETKEDVSRDRDRDKKKHRQKDKSSDDFHFDKFVKKSKHH